MRPIRVYADTTVYGGIVDDEFREASLAFFDQVRQGRFSLVMSAVVEEEVLEAPEPVVNLYREMEAYATIVETTDEIRRLRQAYLNAGVVTPRSATDALHVAIASSSECSLILSWNFKHIVQYSKVQKYNAVNQLNGYPIVAIYSPREATSDEE